MTGLERIVEWAKNKPLWWQDALRRIVEKSKLDETDIEDFVLMCGKAHGIEWTKKPAPEPRPISLGDVPDQTVSEENTTLCVIKDVENVNALAKDQKLEFGDSGLTVVYGDNASGKSGYVRILKLICRARGEKPNLLPNIFQDSHSEYQRAIIQFKVGGQLEDFLWEKDKTPPNQLRAISVFDSKCAVQYVERQNEVAFRPFGLDVLDSLAAVCDGVNEKLEHTKDMVSRNPRDFSFLIGNTQVGKLIENLSYDTNPDTVERLANLTEGEETQLKTLRNLILQIDGDLPEKKITELRLKSTRMGKLKTQIFLFNAWLKKEALEKLEKLLSDATIAKKAAELASKAFSEEDHLKGVGSETWRELWEAARLYSEREAYRDEPFPFLGKNSRCVLCQQKLSDDAKERMQRFEEFVKGTTQNRAKELKRELQMKADAIENMEFDFEIIPGLLEELKFESKELANRFSSFFNYAKAIQREVLTSIKTETWKIAKVLPEVSAEDLDTVIENLRKKAKDFENAKLPEKLTELKKEYTELSSRERLRSDKKAVLEEIDRKKVIKSLDDCITDTHTNTISFFSSNLTKELVNDLLVKTFEVELEKLGLNTIKVQLVSKGSLKGETHHRIEIKDNPGVNIAEIASEGEHRCISLASFLTELSTATHKSGIILDDPISSLDHIWSERIAKRLVEEAKERQVIVFTHDLVFLMVLQEWGQRVNIPLSSRFIKRQHNVSGFCGDIPSWHSMNVRQRIGELNRLLQDAEKAYRNTPEVYEQRVRSIYGKLRETWERAVEEVLFNEVVVRFRRGIATQRLKKVVDITKNDYETVYNGVTKCSRFLEGHDEALAINEPLPKPEDVKDDIEYLDNWVKGIRHRRGGKK